MSENIHYLLFRCGILFEGDYNMNVFEFICGLVMFSITIPIVAIILSYRQNAQKNKIREFELQKEILELELEKQNRSIKLFEEENKKLDKMIND